MRGTVTISLLALFGCGGVEVSASRAASVRLWSGVPAVAWRYRELGPVAGDSCGSWLVAPSEDEARRELQREAAARGAHGVARVACEQLAATSVVCVRALRCRGVAVQWEPGQ